VADSQREAEETAQIREASSAHSPTQPCHTQPWHNQGHTPRLAHPEEAPETYTERQRRHMPRPCLPLTAKLQSHSQERPQPNHQAKKEHNDTKAGKPAMARHDHAMA